jgi:hypothetical protein
MPPNGAKGAGTILACNDVRLSCYVINYVIGVMSYARWLE